LLRGLVASLVLFFIPYSVLTVASNDAGLDLSDFAFFAFTVFSTLVVVVTAQISLETSYWTVYNHAAVWGSIAFYFLLAFVYYQVSNASKL
jgi:phospholipid-translocating ATPase